MESERRVGSSAVVLLAAVTGVLGVGLVAGLQPGATVAGALGIGAIIGIVSIAAVDRAPSMATVATVAAAATADGPSLVSVLALELERGRRHEHPLSVIRVPVAAADPADVETVVDQLRAIDQAVFEGDSVYLVLPGADRAAVDGCVARLEAAAPELLASPMVRRASFPDDGITLGGLLAVLDGALPLVATEDLPSLERRRRVVVDLTAVTTLDDEPSRSHVGDEVDA